MNRRGSYYINLLKGLDYYVACIFGIPAGIYISSYVRYKGWRRTEAAINWLFRDDKHCERSLAIDEHDIKYYYGSG